MKKIASISLAILAILGGFIAYIIYSERMMARLPVIIKKNPKITFISGSAYYRTSVAGRWNQAMVGQKLQTGYEVKTDKNSQMDIRFHNDMAIRVSDNSIMKIDDLTVRKVFINMSRGSIYGKFEKLFKEYSINVQTPTTIAAVRGTELGFETGKEATTVYSLSGITEIYNPKFKDQRVLLSYEKKVAVKENDPPSNP